MLHLVLVILENLTEYVGGSLQLVGCTARATELMQIARIRIICRGSPRHMPV